MCVCGSNEYGVWIVIVNKRMIFLFTVLYYTLCVNIYTGNLPITELYIVHNIITLVTIMLTRLSRSLTRSASPYSVSIAIDNIWVLLCIDNKKNESTCKQPENLNMTKTPAITTISPPPPPTAPLNHESINRSSIIEHLPWHDFESCHLVYTRRQRVKETKRYRLHAHAHQLT